MKKIAVILLSGGKGSRFSSDLPKQYHPLCGKPIALHSFSLFCSLSIIEEVIVVAEKKHQSIFENQRKVKFALPGNRRQDSVENGLKLLSKNIDFVLTHDAARPLIQKKDLLSLLYEGVNHDACTLSTKATSTIKTAVQNNYVHSTLQREFLYEIQTPQLISKEVLIEGIELAKKLDLTVTDDVSFAEILEKPVKLVMGSTSNIKITNKQDLSLAKLLLQTHE